MRPQSRVILYHSCGCILQLEFPGTRICKQEPEHVGCASNEGT